MELKCKKIVPEAILPSKATRLSACFDINCCLHTDTIKVNGNMNVKVEEDSRGRYVILRPNDTMLVPTGLIFVIPEDMQMKIIPRSGYAWKRKITIINSPGTIDADFPLETMLLVHNASEQGYFRIDDRMKLAQGELMKNYTSALCISEASDDDVQELKQRSERVDGFGSTGK